MTALTPCVTGALFGFSLIVAFGAQNAYVLRQGALRTHVGTVVVICSVSDIVLIVAGVAGMGAVVGRHAGLLTGVRAGGAALLLAYGALAARRAWAGAETRPLAGGGRDSRPRVVAATLGFTWLNPAVYLDTLLLLGSVANAQPGSRWAFGAGAAAASVCWFAGLGFGARLLTPLLSRPGAERLLDAFVAVVMSVTALRLLAG